MTDAARTCGKGENKMMNKYIVVRANSTHGAFVVERNACAPRANQWTKSDVAGYADTLIAARRLARDANSENEERLEER